MIELIVLDIDMGTIVTIKPRKLFYLPDSLASLEPLGVVVRPSEVCDRAQDNAAREKVQSDLASLLERLHPKCRIKTIVRQYKESDTIRGPFSDAVVEVQIDGKYQDLRHVLECRFPGVFYHEIKMVNVAQHSRLLEFEPGKTQILTQSVDITKPSLLFDHRPHPELPRLQRQNSEVSKLTVVGETIQASPFVKIVVHEGTDYDFYFIACSNYNKKYLQSYNLVSSIYF